MASYVILIEKICLGDFQLKRVNGSATGITIDEIAAITGRLRVYAFV
jgi:hypothetical protein